MKIRGYANTVSVSDNFRKKINNDNVNDNDYKYVREKRVDNIADQLCDKFGDRTWRELYCKFARKLPEATIWDNFEQANRKGRNPRLFSFLCKKSMGA